MCINVTVDSVYWLGRQLKLVSLKSSSKKQLRNFDYDHCTVSNFIYMIVWIKYIKFTHMLQIIGEFEKFFLFYLVFLKNNLIKVYLIGTVPNYFNV